VSELSTWDADRAAAADAHKIASIWNAQQAGGLLAVVRL
jgi:hypothetical protein